MIQINLALKGISMDDFDEIFDEIEALECFVLEEIGREDGKLPI